MTERERVAPTVLVRDWLITFGACLAGLFIMRMALGESAAGLPAMLGFPALIATIFLVGRLSRKK